MIKETSGNLLRAEAEALVNTVNTEGVMGKGIALQFKKAYPAMYDDYRKAAKAGEIHLGHVQVWPTGQMTGPKYVINFPTKGHWKSRSRLKDIEPDSSTWSKSSRSSASSRSPFHRWAAETAASSGGMSSRGSSQRSNKCRTSTSSSSPRTVLRLRERSPRQPSGRR